MAFLFRGSSKNLFNALKKTFQKKFLVFLLFYIKKELYRVFVSTATCNVSKRTRLLQLTQSDHNMLSLQSLVGHRVGIPGSLTYTDEQEIQFVSGRSLVRFDIESRVEKVFPGANEAVSGFTAVAITPNRKTTAHAEYVSGSNGADGYPVVSIYEWPKTASGSRKKRVSFILLNQLFQV